VWTASSGVINNDSTLSRTGSWEAYLDGYGTTHTDTLSQTFTAPSPASQLCYWLKITTSETTTTTAYDTLTVQLKNSAGTVVSTQSYSNLNHNTAYAQHCFSISSYGGQTITLAFTGTEDSSLATNFFVDDVTAI
ncbi:MAG: S8 family serine peptidase, partial [Archangium sp.]